MTDYAEAREICQAGYVFSTYHLKKYQGDEPGRFPSLPRRLKDGGAGRGLVSFFFLSPA
jgi:hypothetical protein